MNQEKIKSSLSDMQDAKWAKDWLVEYGQTACEIRNLSVSCSFSFAQGRGGHVEAATVVAQVLKRKAQECIQEAIELCDFTIEMCREAVEKEISTIAPSPALDINYSSDLLTEDDLLCVQAERARRQERTK